MLACFSDGVSRGGGGGGVLKKWESPYQAIVLSSLMEPPIQNGRAAQARAHPTISLASAQAAVPPLQHSLSLAAAHSPLFH